MYTPRREGTKITVPDKNGTKSRIEYYVKLATLHLNHPSKSLCNTLIQHEYTFTKKKKSRSKGDLACTSTYLHDNGRRLEDSSGQNSTSIAVIILCAFDKCISSYLIPYYAYITIVPARRFSRGFKKDVLRSMEYSSVTVQDNGDGRVEFQRNDQ